MLLVNVPWNTAVSSGALDLTFNPWKDFLEDTEVRKRIERFKLLRGRMHLRFTINGNPFLYGRALAAYRPRPTYDDFKAPTTAAMTTMQQSMLPHIFLDPTSSEGGEMILPFFSPNNWIELAGGTADEMGTVRLRSINALNHANSANGICWIAVYGWMSDVKLAAPTDRTYATYTAQSGLEPLYYAAAASVCGVFVTLLYSLYYAMRKIFPELPSLHNPVPVSQSGDEYGTGIISKPASVIARVAGHLSRIPAIKPYARATEMISSSIGKVAHIFGFSRPAIVSDIVKIKPNTVGNLANTDAHEAVAKLTLDSKQELTIDPRTVGLSDVDEMNFKYLCSKECYVGTSTWTEAQPIATTLRTININPMMHNADGNEFQLTPLASVAACFKYWRGSLKIRAQVVASQMHRGRLRIVYDPVFSTTHPPYNSTYTKIIDLATNRDFTFTVGWNAHTAYLDVDTEVLSPPSAGENHNGFPTNLRFSNGVVKVDVMNPLTSPDPTLAKSVYINFYVSAGDDFELCSPHDEILNTIQYNSQSGIEYISQTGDENEELVEGEDNKPESAPPLSDIGDLAWQDPMTHTFFGETVHSIRALLKRYCYHSYYDTPSVADRRNWYREYNFPYYPGTKCKDLRHNTGANGLPVDTPVNFSAMTYLNWFTPMYVGWRGALRSKYVAGNEQGSMIVRRHRPDASGHEGQEYAPVYDTPDLSSWQQLAIHRNCAGGAHVVKSDIDGACEVEFPFYSKRRFAPARSEPKATASNTTLGHVDMHIFSSTGFGGSATPLGTHRYVAAGDDYSLFFFIGPPLMEFVPTEPYPQNKSGTAPISAAQMPGR